jgi:hypothetical protein
MAFLTMRLWRQPVAAGGKEIRLVEAVSGLETIEPFAPHCPLVFPQPFHPFRHSAVRGLPHRQRRRSKNWQSR